MRFEAFHRLEEKFFYAFAAAGGLIVGLGLLAAWNMEEHGHIITGMSNQVVWGTPHIFAIFMIVAASGVLNVASMGSVFGKTVYKPRAPLSGLLALALLAGGLSVLMLDLGRPDRLIVAMTYYNFKSIFAWNIFLYTGFFAIVGVYLWTLMERRMNPYSKYAGFTAFFWRLALTTGTGSIFGFLVARQAFSSAVLAPAFIVMSFAWGLAVFIIAQTAMFSWNNLTLHPHILRRMKNLLGIFIAGALYFITVYHLTNLYFAKQMDFEHFILVGGGIYPLLFWIGYVLIGSVLPLVLLFPSEARRSVPLCRYGLDPGARGRRRPPLCTDHRRPGLPAGDIPRHGGDEFLPRRSGGPLRAEHLRGLPRPGRSGGGVRHHRNRDARAALPAAGRFQPTGRCGKHYRLKGQGRAVRRRLKSLSFTPGEAPCTSS